jgi:hypothetical protein
VKERKGSGKGGEEEDGENKSIEACVCDAGKKQWAWGIKRQGRG